MWTGPRIIDVPDKRSNDFLIVALSCCIGSERQTDLIEYSLCVQKQSFQSRRLLMDQHVKDRFSEKVPSMRQNRICGNSKAMENKIPR